MTDPIEDPMDDQLRQALNSEAARFSPAPTIGATRGHLVGQVHRRQRRLLALTVVALVLVCGGVALGARRSGPSPARQVAAAGTNRLNTAPTNGPGGSPAPAPSAAPAPQPAGQTPGGVGGPGASAVSSAPPGPATPPSSAAVPGGHPATTVSPAPPSGPTTSTSPPATSPPTAFSSARSQVRGTVLFSPVCPVQRTPPDPACAPRPGAAHIQLLRGDGTVAAEGDAGSNGHFALLVAPGSYTVAAKSSPVTAGIGRGCTANPAQVTANPGAVSSVAVSCDTGIR